MRKRTNRKPRRVRPLRGRSGDVGQVWRAVDEDGRFRAYLVTDAANCPTPLAWVPMHRGGLALATLIADAGGSQRRLPAVDLRGHSPEELARVIDGAQLHLVTNRGNLKPGRFAWASYFVPPSGLWAGELVFFWRMPDRLNKKGDRLFSETTAPKPATVRGRTRRKTAAA